MPNLREAISAAYLADEDAIIESLIQKAQLTNAEQAATHALATELVTRLRAGRDTRQGVDAFTQEYTLSSEEGVMLMCLAEALLRVPDAETQDRLIRDKIAGQNWAGHLGRSQSLLVNASTWALMLTGEIVGAAEFEGWDFDLIWRRLVARLGEPVIRQAVTRAVRLLGRHFVLGRTIEEALAEAKPLSDEGYRFSFDMLGEAAVTQNDAERYFSHYHHAIGAIARSVPRTNALFERPGVSIKLTALHPRFEYVQRQRVMIELLPPLAQLCAAACEGNLSVAIDAEEADRLDLMLDVFEALGEEDSLKNWNGLGLAVQGYQKRALPVIEWLKDLAKRQNRVIPVRLVKGAYWDSEIKRAQEQGLSDYPVFTRKIGTDTSYLACARSLLSAPDRIFPQFATHNAHTLSAIEAFAGKNRKFEFQRLHGMGEALYELYGAVARPSRVGAATRIYAPVGSHEDLLAYLVRRLLENGANTSFVNRLANDRAPIEEVIADPVQALSKVQSKRNPRILKPEAIFPGRRNSFGVLLSDPVESGRLVSSMRRALEARVQEAHPLIAGRIRAGKRKPVLDPSDHTRQVGEMSEASDDNVRDAFQASAGAQWDWNRVGGARRAEILERAAELFDQERAHLLALIVREGGRTVGDAQSELREAIDFLRYYAKEAREHFSTPRPLPGPVGEKNELSLSGRGTFACIAPWNFPLSIFTGQVSAALAAGNAVLAKPAEQTPLIASAAVNLLHSAGVPREVLHLVPGDGARIGRVLLTDQRLSGVAFTGSTETAAIINRTLAAREGPIPILIAETGGMNAMIVDSTALPEQVARDVLSSAFNSAGQRCSALRVLLLQEDVADRMLDQILGAMDELVLGDPFELSTDIGPIIDEEARAQLASHAERMKREAKLLRALPLAPGLEHGTFFAPHVFAIESMSVLKREVFGPVLHVVTFAADRMETVCDAINASGYGLTIGVHSRIESTVEFVRERVLVGNMYVNRNQIGAVVEAQPFGGEGLSGTGPKAGGPHYLPRFAVERSVTVNTAAAGGNAALLTLDGN
ncbi:MAG TPA: bifunctional proline dehydrogenase/L-glutamate gamma-semialdehyde dehydrogenase PutA [Micropepsaceae bacterium]|nr:bifunctional proline dehydrogenase/L-glutamate gamma-semialdehyde dehydrogenase PutA [Micropepsaceae bacterium]